MHRAWKSIELPRPFCVTRRLEFVFIGAALACVILAAARVACTISLAAPLQLVSSGAEEEALASIWRFDHGETVYTDPHLLPFTASYFNWLFYASYGSVTKAVLAALHLNNAWLPTVCRLLTLMLTLTGGAIVFQTLRGLTDDRLGRPLALALAALAFLNPLCGFWIVTTRPDIGAAVLELAGVACWLRYRDEPRVRWILGAGLFFAAAWAFKQTAVSALCAILFACLCPGPDAPRSKVSRLGPAALLIALMTIGALLACEAIGPVYQHGLYGSQVNCGFKLAWAARHFGLALVKMPFIAVALAGAAATCRRAAADPAWRAIPLVVVSSFLGDFLASSKGGAGDYYFLPLGIWSALWIGLAIDRLRRTPWLWRLLALASLWQLGAVISVLAGHHGVVDPRNPTKPYEHLAARLAARPGPVLVLDTYGDLPWISPTAPHFILGYANESDARAGETFQSGGWRGLMRRGYFNIVVSKASDLIPETLLTCYHPAGVKAGWSYFERNHRPGDLPPSKVMETGNISGRFRSVPCETASCRCYFARKKPRCFSLTGMPVRSITCRRSSQTLRFSVLLALRSK